MRPALLGPTQSSGYIRAIAEYPAAGTILVGGAFNDKGNHLAQFKDLGGPLTSEDEQPEGFALRQSFPNPFNPSTTISYQVPDSGPVSLKIFNALGVEVAEIVSEFRHAGSYSHTFDAGDLGSGLYFYQLRTASVSATKSMTLIK